MCFSYLLWSVHITDTYMYLYQINYMLSTLKFLTVSHWKSIYIYHGLRITNTNHTITDMAISILK